MKKTSNVFAKEGKTTPQDEEQKIKGDDEESEDKVDREYRKGVAKHGDDERVPEERAERLVAIIRIQSLRKVPKVNV